MASPRRPALQLLGCAFAIELVYVAAVAGPLSLLTNGSRLADLGDLTGITPTAAALVTAGLVLLFGMYLAAFRSIASAGRLGSIVVVTGSAMFSSTLALMYPATAMDVYNYVVQGHLIAFDGMNPLLASPSAASNDPFTYYAGSWSGSTSPYGPVWLLLMVPIALAAGNSVVTAVLLAKCLAALGVVATTVLLLLHGRLTGTNGITAAFLFGWNPLVQIELVGNGHNDALMVMLLVVGIVMLTPRLERRGPGSGARPRTARRAPARGSALAFQGEVADSVEDGKKSLITLIAIVAISLTASALVKYLTAPALGFALLALLAVPRRRGPARLIAPLVFLLVVAATVAITFAPFWVGPSVLQRLRDVDGNYLSSIPALIILIDRGAMGWLIYPRVAIVAAVVAGQAWRVVRRKTPLAAALFDVELAIIVVATHFAGWYVPLLLALALLSGRPRQIVQALSLTFATTLTTPLWAYLWPAEQPGLTLLGLHLILVPLTFLPLAVAPLLQARLAAGLATRAQSAGDRVNRAEPPALSRQSGSRARPPSREPRESPSYSGR
jgi:hypothetical protein